MKKFLLFASVAALAVSCNDSLKENEFLVSGTIDTIYNGKQVFLREAPKERNAPGVSLDTAVVENGKFTFKGMTETPQERFLFIEGEEQNAPIRFFAEEGNIAVNVNKDTIYNSKVSGTFNNDVLAKYNKLNNEVSKKGQELSQEYTKASQEQDENAIKKIEEEFETFSDQMYTKFKTFIEENPTAEISIQAFPSLLRSQNATYEELQSVFDKLSQSSKDSDLGKKISEYLEKKKEADNAKSATSVGKQVPDFAAPTPDGKMLSIKEAMGKVTIIDLWASWCGPCRKENPNVVAMYNELHGKGLNIIGVSLDQDGDKWKQAIAADKLTWQHISNLKGWDEPIAKQFGVNSIPATVILDANGVIVARDLRGDELKAKVEELLAK
ncbi:redoxin domain-containing protein [Flavobacterium rakeshii]|uniref:Redoxin domain-containing protein n=1 Tax=Flavobacterium rakeshii TaxID=1038845 RepID=A0A6N8HFU2_9FLAO|nr:redoxin domain-containing protein [Flavobacterium rakeshii]MEE1900125.1 redoxin domain-containing protein [Flavobacterium rakeshii]MUV04568.1 redoxin domain-containing protein [Flavobacterium rakeshii]